jgi:acetyl/propionyl-CoA carboxylase alpha subunit
VIEETPSPAINAKTRKKMGEVAVKISEAVSYHGAGTVEFILDQKGNFYFLEMNTRIQVEHPVTEMVTGFDIVKWMIRIANGEKLPFKQKNITMKGHAIECRVYAEDPEMNFIPSPGKIVYFRAPNGPGIRNDSSIYSGSEITPFYDPMISKLIVWGETREVAISKMISALKEFVVLGVKTNIGFLLRVMANNEFKEGTIDTGFIERHSDTLKPTSLDIEPALVAAAIAMRDASHDIEKTKYRPASNWKLFSRKLGLTRNNML